MASSRFMSLTGRHGSTHLDTIDTSVNRHCLDTASTLPRHCLDTSDTSDTQTLQGSMLSALAIRKKTSTTMRVFGTKGKLANYSNLKTSIFTSNPY